MKRRRRRSAQVRRARTTPVLPALRSSCALANDSRSGGAMPCRSAIVPRMEVDRDEYAAVADQLERELRALGAWRPEGDDPGPPEGAFGGPYQSATEWVQFTLLPR